MVFSRRFFLTGLLAVTGSGHALAQSSGVISAKQAYELALAGKIKLVDVRTPQEWRQTGIAKPGYAISMHQRGFLDKLNRLVGNDKSAPVAFICATGARSGYVMKALRKAGYSNVMSVGEGMLGSAYGKGWIKQHLPVKKP